MVPGHPYIEPMTAEIKRPLTSTFLREAHQIAPAAVALVPNGHA